MLLPKELETNHPRNVNGHALPSLRASTNQAYGYLKEYEYIMQLARKTRFAASCERNIEQTAFLHSCADRHAAHASRLRLNMPNLADTFMTDGRTIVIGVDSRGIHYIAAHLHVMEDNQIKVSLALWNTEPVVMSASEIIDFCRKNWLGV